MLLATGATQYIWLGVIFALLIAFFVYSYFKNKKDQDRYKQMTESLEKGDKVLTASGIIGKIVSIEVKDPSKILTLETGDNKNKGYIAVDSQAVYVLLEKANAPMVETPVVEEVKMEESVLEEIPANVEEKPKKKNKK